MCDKCNDAKEIEAMLFKEYSEQEGLKEGDMIRCDTQTVVLGNKESILILQKAYDRSITNSDGATSLPDSRVNAIELSPDKLEDFIGELIFAAGPQAFMKMLSDSLNAIGLEGDDSE